MNEMSKSAIIERERQIDRSIEALEWLLADSSLRECYELRSALYEIGRRLNEERYHLEVKETYLREQEKNNPNGWGLLSPDYEYIQAVRSNER